MKINELIAALEGARKELGNVAVHFGSGEVEVVDAVQADAPHMEGIEPHVYLC